MKLSAYVLAGDPTWIEHSIPEYYSHVDRIIVSFDADGVGWTGRRLNVRRALDALASVDVHGKMEFIGGRYSTPGKPMAGEVAQRNAALRVASQDADWVVQLDPDECPPPFDVIRATLATASAQVGVSWPMVVLYRRIGDSYLVPCQPDGRLGIEHGCIAVRPNSRLIYGRNPDGPILTVESSTVPPIVHNSWARSPASTFRKVLTWGHSSKGMVKYAAVQWLPAPLVWRRMHNLHPLEPSIWPALCRLTWDELESLRTAGPGPVSNCAL